MELLFDKRNSTKEAAYTAIEKLLAHQFDEGEFASRMEDLLSRIENSLKQGGDTEISAERGHHALYTTYRGEASSVHENTDKFRRRRARFSPSGRQL